MLYIISGYFNRLDIEFPKMKVSPTEIRVKIILVK